MNNKKVLRKCLEELEKPEPNISYIRGMLEVLCEEEELPLYNGLKDALIPGRTVLKATVGVPNVTEMTEEEKLNNLNAIKALEAYEMSSV